MWKNIQSSYIGECFTLSLKASYDAANNILGAVFAAGATILLGSIVFIQGNSTTAQAVNATATLAIYTIYAWIIFLVLRMLFIAPYRLWQKHTSKIKALEAELSPLITWNIRENFALETDPDKPLQTFQVCLVHIRSKGKSIESGQLLMLHNNTSGYYICAPFAMRPDEERYVPIFRITNDNRAIVYNFHQKNGEWIRHPQMAWLPDPGQYALKMIATDMRAIMLHFGLNFVNDRWSVTDVSR